MQRRGLFRNLTFSQYRVLFSWNNGKDDDADMATFTGKIARG